MGRAEVKGARRVSRSAQAAVPAERALRAFVDLEQLKQWWGARDGLVEARRGGTWSLAWGGEGAGYRFVVCGVFKSLKPGQYARVEPLTYFNAQKGVFGGMRLRVSVREKEGCTRVRVTQEGFGEGPAWDWYYQAMRDGWKEALANLKRFLEGPEGVS
ncbi:MAG: SRPBCC domain-containing protein [Terriglobia bacterium]